MLGELDFYLPKSFCSTNVYGEYTEGKNSIVGVIRVSRGVGGWFNRPKKCLTPSILQNSKKLSKVCSRVMWNIVTMAGS